MLDPTDSRPQVEGFGRLISEPNQHPMDFNRPGPDFRGPGPGAMTHDWWRPAQPDEPDLVWQTAPVPAAVDTTFVFIGDSANRPENMYPPNQATLYADDRPVITFDLGLRQPKQWQAGEWTLDFSPRLVAATVDGYNRLGHPRGCCGIYRLAAPASALCAGQPLQLKVILAPQRSDVITWFAIHGRSDALELSPATNLQQIEQLQQEVIQWAIPAHC
jgi:hypothetical protein